MCCMNHDPLDYAQGTYTWPNSNAMAEAVRVD